MARSAIIKDLANSTVDTMTALKRAKVLFAELGNDDLLEWVSYEIAGYPADANLPDYRKVRGRLVGSYIKGSMASHMKWTNVSLPLGTMPDNIQEALLSVYFREGVGALRQLAESSKEDGQLGKTIDADLFPVIATYNKDPYGLHEKLLRFSLWILSPPINRLFSVLWYQPHTAEFCNTRYSVFFAQLLNPSFGNAPLFCRFWGRDIFKHFAILP